MSENTLAQAQKKDIRYSNTAHNPILQRQCACGQYTIAGSECAECRKKRETLQRTAVNHHTTPATAPPIVHEVLHSPGQPLDPATRAYMEPQFGHDFSQVPLTESGQEMKRFHPIARYNNHLQTECDVKIHPDDLNLFLLRRKFRTVGSGTPYIIHNDALRGQYPCLYEAAEAHEQIHITNARPHCRGLKTCVDRNSSRTLWIFEPPRISHADFENCYSQHHGGLAPDCVADEKQAYEAGIQRAEALLNERRCTNERQNLERNIRYWRSIEDSAPNCRRNRRSPTP